MTVQEFIYLAESLAVEGDQLVVTYTRDTPEDLITAC